MDDGSSDLPSSWNDDAGSGRKRWPLYVLGGVVVVGLVIGAVVLVQRKVEESKVAWPASVGGRAPGLGSTNVPAPEVDVTAEPGVYAWSDFDGWHLWVVHGEGVGRVTGTITSDKDFSEVDLAVEGAGTARKDGSTIELDLPAQPELVGVDFSPGFYGKRLTFDLEGPDGPIDPKVVTLGPRRTVSRVPFTIEMVQEDDAPSS